MDHSEAIQSTAAERYLLEEMSPLERDSFEEHYFDCPECAADLRATAAFLETAKQELKSAPRSKPASEREKRSLFVLPWKPVLAWGALAASLLFTVYQNVVTYPHLSGEIAQLKAPEVLPTLSLVSGNSRGGEVSSLAVSKTQPFLLQVDIPTQDRFLSYTCSLYSPSGSLAWHVQVSAQEAKDTVSIRVPAVEKVTGSYALIVRGDTDKASAGPANDLAHYRFNLNLQN
ncbi:anti-sigma factor [Granulicella sp. S190]|uniref:anti-sigma factor family protein n=1 Tax=Granulicella sp. S190 TaxID=1747226 RepID=UPI00131D4AA2|nr:zf-HC2 domain-containing protein [Granulicella sp. S190]